ncbi:hypothetical protein [Streptomyces sp. NPDC090798]|uniref:hypothetical protein n=1 Tax=Streptomyces sp. NPDC090798 TaxID=3365968 RepID=UPI003804302C
MAEVITKEESNGRSYVRRAMKKLAELGLAETNGKDGPSHTTQRFGQGVAARAQYVAKLAN